MYAIGLDVGGTKLAGAIVDTDTGETLDLTVAPTNAARGGAMVLEDLFTMRRDLLRSAEQSRRDIVGIGVGVAELVDLDGVVRSSSTLQWDGLDVRHALGNDRRSVVVSDVVAGALAEARLGAGSGATSVLYVSIGTGVSSTMVFDGRPWIGARGNAILMASGRVACWCDTCGTLSDFVPEDVASGTGIARLYNQRSGRAPVSGAREVVDAAEHGDVEAANAIETAGRVCGSLVGNAVNLLDPHRVVIGGGLGSSAGSYWDSLLVALRDHVWAPASKNVEVVRATFAACSGVVGAALAALPDDTSTAVVDDRPITGNVAQPRTEVRPADP